MGPDLPRALHYFLTNLFLTGAGPGKNTKQSYMIDVSVNHESYQLDDTINVQRLIERLDLSESGIAIAINNVIINRSDWRQTQLSDQDNVLIIQAVQGG